MCYQNEKWKRLRMGLKVRVVLCVQAFKVFLFIGIYNYKFACSCIMILCESLLSRPAIAVNYTVTKRGINLMLCGIGKLPLRECACERKSDRQKSTS